MARVRRFCICIPTRAGVVVLTLLNLMATATLPTHPTRHPSPLRMFKSLESLVVMLLATLGFIGAVKADRRLVRVYSRGLWAFFAAYLLIDAAYLAVSFPPRKTLEHECFDRTRELLRKPEDQTVEEWERGIRQGCQYAYVPAVLFSVLGLAIVKFVALWTCMIVHRYKQQLDEEAIENGIEFGNVPQTPSSPAGRAPHRPLSGAVLDVPALPSYSDIVADEGSNPAAASQKKSDAAVAKLVDDAA